MFPNHKSAEILFFLSYWPEISVSSRARSGKDESHTVSVTKSINFNKANR